MSQFVRIPPDSTGKKIRHDGVTEVVYSNPTNLLYTLNRGDVLIGFISGITGKFVSYESDDSLSILYLDDVTGNFSDGEILLSSSQTVCTFISQVELYTQKNLIIDKYNPEHSMTVDKYGSAYVRYREGEQLFDTFGNAQVSMTNRIVDFVFTYASHDDKFYTNLLGGGGVTHSTIQSTNILYVDNQSGSSAYRQTIINYPYVPGYGTFMSVSLSCGDNGKSGLTRRWGLYDDEDGCFFELTGSTFSVNIRSSTSGTFSVDSISLNDFNGDVDYVIDFSKFNLYWLDYQWQGVGRVRFGAFKSDGSRVLFHTIEHSNKYVAPYMRRGTLPFRYEIVNTSTTSSSSELKVTCVSIARQGGGANELITTGENFTYVSPEKQVGSSNVPMLTVKPKVYFNGIKNHIVSTPTEIHLYATGPVILTTIGSGTITGATYNVTLDKSSVELDYSASSISGGVTLESSLFSEGVTQKLLGENLRHTISVYPNLYQPTASFCLKSLNGATVSAVLLVRWKEIY